MDDQPLFRLGLRKVLEEAGGVSVLGDSPASEEAVERVCSLQPAVTLIGSAPPQYRGLDLCRRISHRSSGLPIIILSPAEESGELFEAIRSGAWAYLSKRSSAEAVLETIRRVSQGDMPVQDTVAAYPEVSRRLLEEFQSLTRNPRLQRIITPLSPREMEILHQLGVGRSNKEIANVLNITVQTVKNHITAILRKLDVNDRTQAVLAGLRHGWITLDSSPGETGLDAFVRSNN